MNHEPEETTNGGIPAAGPVFVIGCPRSGTSALSWAVAQHPDFWTSAESNFLWHLFARGQLRESYQKTVSIPNGWLRKHEVSFEEFAAALGSGVDSLFRSRSGGKRWIDASPENTLLAAEIAHLFPDARFLHLLRDGRAVVNSMINSGFDTRWAREFPVACKTWVHYALSGTAFETGDTRRVLGIRHERLVSVPSEVSTEILRFLGVSPSEKPAAFLATRRVNSSYAPHEGVGIKQAIDPAKIPSQPWNKWENRRRRQFLNIAGETMENLGYDLSSWDQS